MKKSKARGTRRANSSRKPVRKRSAGAASRVAGNKVALKGTVSKTPRKSELRHAAWDSIPVESLNPLLGRQLVVGQNIMLARVLLKKGCVVPEHSHPNEQVTYVLDGALKFWIEGREIVVRGGEVLTIPPNMPHKAEAPEDTVTLDVFHPPRADWMSGKDSYLR
jgi:quercetin dioxygenase-like cupin family protein